MVVAETANPDCKMSGHERQTKPKVQLAAMTPDILGAVALYHMHGCEKVPERGFDPDDGEENGLFRARHWVAKAMQRV